MAQRFGYQLKWNGPAVSAYVRKATREAMDETMGACVVIAKSRVRVDTGNLRDSIRFLPSRTQQHLIIGSWGAFGVHYAIWQEIGTVKMSPQPYLRPAWDTEYPRLPERIARRVKGRG